MSKVDTIIDKIEEIEESKSKIISALLKNGTEISRDTPLKEIPDIIVDQSVGGGGALSLNISIH